MENVIRLESDRLLKLISISSREVRLQHHPLSEVTEVLNKEGEIESVRIDDYDLLNTSMLNIKLFDSKIRPFKIQHIKRSRKENSYTLFSTKLTKATKWIMPMLRITNETRTSMKFDSHFINCYVGTKDTGYMNEIYLIYRFSGEMNYKVFEEGLKHHVLFDRMIDLDHQHVMYVFSMNQEQCNIFELFKQGKYSKFPDNYKNKILNFNINPALINPKNIRETADYGILYKTSKQRKVIEDLTGTSIDKKLELYSIPEEKEEMYTGDIEIEKTILTSDEFK